MLERLLGNLVGAAILCVLAALTYLWIDNRGGVFADYAAENETYAATYFDGLFPYDSVLASQKWHPKGAEAWDCTYAVVSLGDNAPTDPDTRDRADLGWQFAWGGDWLDTPAPSLGDTTRDAIAFCATRLPEGLGARLQSALISQGSLYIRDSIGETVMIYAPDHGLAARIGFGD